MNQNYKKKINKRSANITFKKTIKKFLIASLILIVLSSTCFAATPKLITNLEKNLDTIKDWIIKIATPAAAVAVGARYINEKI